MTKYMGVFDGITAARKQDYKSETAIVIYMCAKELSGALINLQALQICDYEYEYEFIQRAVKYGLDSLKLRSCLAISVAHLTYGDFLNRHYSITYYNPTKHHLLVQPLGITDESGRVITHIEPGGRIQIPESYTKGGKASAVYTTAPQLRQVPRKHPHDSLLDLSPLCFHEWVTHLPSRSSPCCKCLITWSDVRNGLMCPKCEKRISVV